MKKLVILCVLMLSLSACAMNNKDVDMLNARVQQQDMTIRQLNNQISGVQPAQADTWSQVQSLRQEVAALRGEVDNLSRIIGQTNQKYTVADTLNKHQRALEQIDLQLALGLNVAEPDPNTIVNTGDNLNTIPANQATTITGQTSPVTPVVTPPVASNVKPATPAPSNATDTAQALYDSGMNSFNARKYQDSLNAFTDFIKTYPSNKLVSNAWFWQGECHYQLGNFPAAIISYEEVISKFPNSGKAPAAYLKQGMSFNRTNKADAAKIRLEELVKKYPKSAEATRAAALLKDM